MSWDLAFYKQQPQVVTSEGDVLVCQEFSNYLMNHESGEKLKSEAGAHKLRGDGKSGTGFNQDYFFIRYGQAVGSWMRKSSSNSEHAALVTVGWDESGGSLLGARICDANVDSDEKGKDLRGVAIRGWNPRPSYVYRCNTPALRQEAAAVARNLARRVRPYLRAVAKQEQHVGAYAGGGYDWDQAAKSVTKFKYVNKESAAFVDACYEVAYPPSHGPRNTILPGMFCSGFVVVCYMVAAKKLDLGGKGLDFLGNLNVDPRAISPKALQSLLERNSLFARVGRPYHDAT